MNDFTLKVKCLLSIKCNPIANIYEIDMLEYESKPNTSLKEYKIINLEIVTKIPTIPYFKKDFLSIILFKINLN